MAYDKYRKKLRIINKSITHCLEKCPDTFVFCVDFHNYNEDRLELLRAFRKEIATYKEKLPSDLIEKIDLKEFKDYAYSWTFGVKDDGWYTWGPRDEIETTFAYYYHACKNFNKAMEKTKQFYKKTTRQEWYEGRTRFLELLLLS